MRILVVDDDRAVRESLRRSLSFNGYSVDLAQDGLEAVAGDVVSYDPQHPALRVTGTDLSACVAGSTTHTAGLFCDAVNALAGMLRPWP